MFDICVNLHSEQFRSDPQGVLDRAFESGLSGISLTGSCLDSSHMAIEYAEGNSDQLCATVGIHPHSAKDFTEKMWSKMQEMARKPIVRAVGECGLDYFRNLSTPSQQRQCFERHIALAMTLNKPLFLHQRDGFEAFIEILDHHAPHVPVLVHCFTDGLHELEAYLERGYFIGITGWIADTRRNQSLLEAIPHLPLERLMIETDAPWLTPRNIPKFRKVRTNEPQYLSYVVSAISEHTGHSVHDIIEHSTTNARRFFGWS